MHRWQIVKMVHLRFSTPNIIIMSDNWRDDEWSFITIILSFFLIIHLYRIEKD